MSAGIDPERNERDCALALAPGLQLHYRIQRAGNPRGTIVFLHGAASNLTRWSELFETTALAATFNLIRVDLRGHAGSLARGPIGLEIWADDIAAILDREGIRQTFLCGHCLGANVATTFATRHPDRTAGLVLVEPMLRAALTGTLRRLKWMTPLLRIAIWLVRLANALGIRRPHLETLDLRELDREFRARLALPGGAEALVKRYASPLHDLKTMPTASFLQDLVEVVRPLPLHRLRAPFLALLSTGRTFADPARTRALLQRLPAGEILELDAKHWIPTEQPVALRQALERWVTAAA